MSLKWPFKINVPPPSFFLPSSVISQNPRYVIIVPVDVNGISTEECSFVKKRDYIRDKRDFACFRDTDPGIIANTADCGPNLKRNG